MLLILMDASYHYLFKINFNNNNNFLKIMCKETFIIFKFIQSN